MDSLRTAGKALGSVFDTIVNPAGSALIGLSATGMIEMVFHRENPSAARPIILPLCTGVASLIAANSDYRENPSNLHKICRCALSAIIASLSTTVHFQERSIQINDHEVALGLLMEEAFYSGYKAAFLTSLGYTFLPPIEATAFGITALLFQKGVFTPSAAQVATTSIGSYLIAKMYQKYSITQRFCPFSHGRNYTSCICFLQ